MQYTLNDLEGDVIVVLPADAEGIVPKVAIAFIHEESDSELVMLLDDRIVKDLTTALQMALVESERKG